MKVDNSSWNKRFIGGQDEEFFGCVNEKGEWFDSSKLFETAVHWVACNDGHHRFTFKEEREHMDNSKCSIIHSSILQKMFEAGLIK